MNEKKIRIGITHGDINGIGYEIILKALSDIRMNELCTLIVYGSSKVAGFYKKNIPALESFSFNVISSAADANPKRSNLINCIDENAKIDVGQSTPEAGKYAVEALDAAMNDLRQGLIDVIVTCPVNKSNVQGDGFNFKGHTEYFAARCSGEEPLMFMVSELMKIGLVTVHEPLKNVSDHVSQDAILKKLRLMRSSLRQDFDIGEPKIAVLSLNPHAGDNGLLGNEENQVIIPAVKTAREEGLLVFGPYAADGFFGSEQHRKFDAVLAMYHDQGLIPFKALTGMEGVNFTAGLSIIRTSPDHGVGYDIAGQNKADEQSLRQAIYTAVDIYRNRETYRRISANPLPHYAKEIGGRDESAADVEAKTGYKNRYE